MSKKLQADERDQPQEMTPQGLQRLTTEKQSALDQSIASPPVGLLAQMSIQEQLVLAKDRKTDLFKLGCLAMSSSLIVRAAVAANPHTPNYALLSLAQDQDSFLRFTMANNKDLPKVVLELLATDSKHYISWTAEQTLALKSVSPTS